MLSQFTENAKFKTADHSGRSVFVLPNTEVEDSNSNCVMCVCFYDVFSCVGSGLVTGCYAARGVLQTVYMSRKLRNRGRGSS
jgi:hypothetical protein